MTMAAEVIIISDDDNDSDDGVDTLPKCLYTLKKEPLFDSDRIEDTYLNEDTVLDEDAYVDYFSLCMWGKLVSIVRVKGVSIVIDMF